MYTNCVVTRWHRSPELLLGARRYGGEVDIYGASGESSLFHLDGLQKRHRPGLRCVDLRRWNYSRTR